MDEKLNVYAILLAGGKGTRLWPVSREQYPKQLVAFIGKDSLVQRTVKRLEPVIEKDLIRIVCGKNHEHEIGKQIKDLGVDPAGKLFIEPCGRNTGPAILLAVLAILKHEKDAVLFLFPADHVIRDEGRFQEVMRSAIRLAESDHIVTFGITPHYPETGYGYIEADEPVSGDAFKLKRFVEKPDRDTAEQYVKSGRFYWNSGMFAFRASVIIDEFKRHQPALLAAMQAMTEGDGEIDPEAYGGLPDISIDYAIMEKTGRGVILPSDFGWSDIGSWKSLYDFLPKDENNNVIDGDVIAKDSRNCFIMGNDRLIAANRINNLVIIGTSDSVFVSEISTSRDVKFIVEDLKRDGRKEYRKHNTVFNRWGSHTYLDHQADYESARLVIDPGAGCPVEPDGVRSFVMVVQGRADIEFPDGLKTISAGESVILDGRSGAVINNKGMAPLHVIQVKTSSSAPDKR